MVFGGLGDKTLAHPVFWRLLEQQNSAFFHQESQQGSFLRLEQIPVFILEIQHPENFFMVLFLKVISICPVDDHAESILDILEGLEGSEETAEEPGKLVGPDLANMALVNNQNNLNFGVEVEEPLDVEGVGDILFLTLVVLESGAVVKRHFLNNDLGGD